MTDDFEDSFEDSFEENVYMYCPLCDEEYYVSENCEECPICNSSEIELC